nr:TMV resistance protein N-like [Quercus suber]
MAAMSAKGPPVTTSDEAEALACRKALEFSINADFLELIIEGDNAYVMKNIGSSLPNQALLGIIIDDVKCLTNGMQNVYVSSIRREGNMVAHALARFAKNVSEDLYWLEDTPPPVVDELLESEIIQDIVKVIMEKLSSKSSSINKNLIGIKSIVAELILLYLGFGNDIYMMEICGSSFIAKVRERSEKGELHELQQQLLDEILEGSNTKIYNVQVGVKNIKSSGLRHKKVLLVLDDVNHKDQLEKLVGEYDWFGLGSWIIITTRNEHVLVNHGVLKIYKPNGLDDDDASKLFCSKAFKKVQPKEGYMQLSQKVVGYASSLPLALVTLGSFLVGRTIEEW